MCLCCMYHVIFQESEADIRVFYVLHMSNEQVCFFHLPITSFAMILGLKYFMLLTPETRSISELSTK